MATDLSCSILQWRHVSTTQITGNPTVCWILYWANNEEKFKIRVINPMCGKSTLGKRFHTMSLMCLSTLTTWITKTENFFDTRYLIIFINISESMLMHTYHIIWMPLHRKRFAVILWYLVILFWSTRMAYGVLWELTFSSVMPSSSSMQHRVLTH